MLSQEAGVPDEEIFYQFDALGNVVTRLDLAGNVLSSDEYDAWGNLLARSGATNDPFGYKGEAGYYTDAETGLLLCTWRYYDPETGRWVTRDPIGYAGGINLYGYCNNSPILLVDPVGLYPDGSPWVYGIWNGSIGVGDQLLRAEAVRIKYNQECAKDPTPRGQHSPMRDALKVKYNQPENSTALSRAQAETVNATRPKVDTRTFKDAQKTNPGVNSAARYAGSAGKALVGVGAAASVYHITAVQYNSQPAF